jgi:hypothetical protein
MHEAEVLIAAIHRDWGEAQGHYDEFRFFTGLCKTKTREGRRVQLCRRR